MSTPYLGFPSAETWLLGEEAPGILIGKLNTLSSARLGIQFGILSTGSPKCNLSRWLRLSRYLIILNRYVQGVPKSNNSYVVYYIRKKKKLDKTSTGYKLHLKLFLTIPGVLYFSFFYDNSFFY